jgi:hypothetical protein
METTEASYYDPVLEGQDMFCQRKDILPHIAKVKGGERFWYSKSKSSSSKGDRVKVIQVKQFKYLGRRT